MSHGEDFGNDSAENFVGDTEKKIKELRQRVDQAHDGDHNNDNLQELRKIEDEAQGIILNVGPHLKTPSNRISSDELARLQKAYDGAKQIQRRALESFMDKAATALGLPEVE